ncbi:MAG: hypothetical protein ACTS8Z_03380, partial [Candidatus Limnocylindrales bacterium]
FEQYRFPGFPVPDGETPFSYLVELCQAGARKRYHPLTSAVVKRLAHELDVIERAGLAEFFLICWDLMRFAREQKIPAQGRGSAVSSIVAYTLGISRVEPISHNLLFERFINEGRTTYPDVDIDFSSARREEVIQYVYNRYGPEHTGMVCNLVTYRARSAVREVGYALGFPRPLVDRVAKALETYDSVMVRRDLEADGGFAEFFRRTGEGLPAETRAAATVEAHGFVDRMGQLNTRIPLVGKVPPWHQPPKPVDPNAPRPFGWLREASAGPEVEAGATVGAEATADGEATPTAGATGSGAPATNVHGPAPSVQSGVPTTLVRANHATGSGATATPTVGAPGGSGPWSGPRPRRSARAGPGATGSGTSATNVHGPAPSVQSGVPTALVRANHAIESGAATRDGTATSRAPAWPGCRRVAGRATPANGRVTSRSMTRAGWRCRRPGRPTGWGGHRCGIPRPRPRRRTRWRGSSLSHAPRLVAVPRSGSPTGSAGSSSVPGSTASRATSPSTAEGCS